ncbi:MAG TPA: SGNH/GDSL hydrolase family protein [Streptosporangiaceae bacterium]|jgi:lysophospholipase L1-like esterase|nr:SGNH/GDSL hydrolase family protein [Streptosporangiaceae bacterium]
MRSALPALAVAACLAGGVISGCSASAPAAHAPAQHKAPASYYLALGDSLSQGVQPSPAGASVETRHGYANLLYAVLRRRDPGLRLADLGCPGETTATMIHGGICSYPGGSQLAAAVRFLRAHRGHVSLITVDIGANDPNSCMTHNNPVEFMPCLGKAVVRTSANLTKIMTTLHPAADRARIIGMNYYLPELAEWRNGFLGQALARVAEVAAVGYNNVLTRVYQDFGIRVANVFGAFHTTDFGNAVTVPGYGRLPRNVAAICQWTWQCAAPPRGPNQHANPAGYAVIAHAFLLADAG